MKVLFLTWKETSCQASYKVKLSGRELSWFHVYRSNWERSATHTVVSNTVLPIIRVCCDHLSNDFRCIKHLSLYALITIKKQSCYQWEVPSRSKMPSRTWAPQWRKSATNTAFLGWKEHSIFIRWAVLKLSLFNVGFTHFLKLLWHAKTIYDSNVEKLFSGLGMRLW